MGRPRIVVPADQARKLFRLFGAGESTRHIAELCELPIGLVQRTLQAEFGPLTAARKSLAMHRVAIAAQLGQSETSMDYREGFEAGCRMALTWVKVHGVEPTRTYWNETLVPWRDSGLYGPPAFVRWA